jgi:hypothetical protein
MGLGMAQVDGIAGSGAQRHGFREDAIVASSGMA